MGVVEGGAPWLQILETASFRDALAPTDTGLTGLDSRLRSLADSADGDDQRYLANLLAAVASFWPRPDDFQSPYGPMMVLADGQRTAIPSDLAERDLLVLTAVVDALPEHTFRSRVLDVLALHGDRSLRPQRHAAQVRALVENGPTAGSIIHAHDQWERGVVVAVRFGSATQVERDALERMLVEAALASPDGHLVVLVARMLRKHDLGRPAARDIAVRLMAVTDTPDSFAARNTLEEAAQWFRRAGDAVAAEDAAFRVVESLVLDADDAAQVGGRGEMVAAVHLEEALQKLRTIPRSARDRLGAGELAANLARRIREAGASAISEMQTFRSESGDLSEFVQGLVDHLSGQDTLETLRRFAEFQSFARYEATKASAERNLVEHPLSALFPVRHFDRDGRTVFRSDGDDDDEVYGEKGPVWRHMVQDYQFRIGLLGGALIPRAWLQLTSEHQLRLRDFEAITHGSSIVPPGQEALYARGLLQGYEGDFASAGHLLAPRVEAVVRYHLANSGERTSAIDSDGIENELGLSALMKNTRTVELFGPDITFEIRALLCGPIGPNLRNDVAHGLVDDSMALSSAAVYLWWVALKLAFVPYWNALHDAEAADAREAEAPTLEDEPEVCEDHLDQQG